MFTLGYQFKPWTADKSIADAETILGYIHETVAEFDLEQHISLPHEGRRRRLVDRARPLDTARWRRPDGPRTMTCGFLYSCAGYFDYDRGLHAGVPRHRGLRGRGRAPAVLARGPGVRRPAGRGHRQRRDRRDAGAGDGRAGRPRDDAPAQPHLDRRASRVATSSPTPCARSCPPRLAHRVIRTKNILFTLGFYQYCQRFPDRARRLLLGLTTRHLRGDRGAGRGALHPDVRPVGPAVLRRPRRRPVPHHPARRRRRRHRPRRRVRARGHPAEERPRARGRPGRHRDRADPEAVRRDRAVRRRRDGRPARAVRLAGRDAHRVSPTSRSASATPTPRGPCAPT